MEHPLLHVISFVLAGEQDVRSALRHLRRLMLSDGPSMLLFADLEPAAGERMPQDLPLIRMLQSGVMSMNEKSGAHVFLLVRRRVWDDASRQFAGAGQALSCRAVIAQLLACGKTAAAFDAATIAPASLEGRYAAVLFSSLSHACTPDTPLRMLSALSHAPSGALAASVLHPRTYPYTVLARAALCAPLSLSPLHAARAHALSRDDLALPSAPIICTAEALIAAQHDPHTAIPLARDCCFVRSSPVSLRELFATHTAACMRQTSAESLVPPIQVLLLFACALWGSPWLAALALLPELWSLMHPRAWPGALLRTALLPLTAFISLDALLCRLLARSVRIRLRVPPGLLSAQGVMLTGAALLPLSIASAHALAAMLPVCLLWLSAPILMPALESPTIERIPLDAAERAHMRSLAEGAFFDAAEDTHASASLRMLAACAGCMLGLLEPDEAARRVQALLGDQPLSPVDRAARLVCAQFLREHMAACDAALRDLPAQLEAFAIVGSVFSLFSTEHPHPLDALFLPLGPARATPQHPLTLPLTHPHTFLKRHLLFGGTAPQPAEPTACFLVLAAAALSHPFHTLLSRSPVAAPYMLMLSAHPF